MGREQRRCMAWCPSRPGVHRKRLEAVRLFASLCERIGQNLRDSPSSRSQSSGVASLRVHLFADGHIWAATLDNRLARSAMESSFHVDGASSTNSLLRKRTACLFSSFRFLVQDELKALIQLPTYKCKVSNCMNNTVAIVPAIPSPFPRFFLGKAVAICYPTFVELCVQSSVLVVHIALYHI